jgi:membrane-bound metal-dependent hydrolase YbcI (DUF457 family)
VPLTPAHTAAAWPLSRLLPSLPLDALVLGTMVPDFEYFLELAPRGRFAHSPMGLLLFCLPVGLIAWAIFRRVVRPASLTLMPPGLRPGLVARHNSLLSATVAIFVGAASHSAWDSFTHAHGWAVRRIPDLSRTVNLAGLGDVRIFKLLQHGSTILGLAAATVWLSRWVGRQPPSARIYSGQSGQRAVRQAIRGRRSRGLPQWDPGNESRDGGWARVCGGWWHGRTRRCVCGLWPGGKVTRPSWSSILGYALNDESRRTGSTRVEPAGELAPRSDGHLRGAA